MRPRRYPIIWCALAVAMLLVSMAVAAISAYAEGECEPQISVERPSANATVRGPMTISGWAIDALSAAGSSSGIGDVLVYRDGEVGAGGVLVGQAAKASRPDVEATYGLVDAQTGFSLNTDFGPLSAGNHMLYVYGLTGCGWASSTLAVVVDSGVSAATVTVDRPTSGSTVTTGQVVAFSGWAADAAGTGTGIDMVQIVADGQPGSGGTVLGTATYAKPRPDVAAAFGKTDWTNTGFEFTWAVAGLTPGAHVINVNARSTASGQWATKAVPLTVIAAPAGALNTARTGTAVIAIESPSQNATVRDVITIRGVAGDCGGGGPATRIRVFAGATTTAPLGEARLGTGNRGIGSLCGAGSAASGNYAWEYTLNSRSLQEGTRTITVQGDFATGTASDSVNVNVDNFAGSAGSSSGSGCYTSMYSNSCGYGSNCFNAGNYDNYAYNGSCNGTAGCYGTGAYGSYGSGCSNGFGNCTGGYIWNGFNCIPTTGSSTSCGNYGYIYNPSNGACLPGGGGSGNCGSGVVILDQAGRIVPISGNVTLTGYALVNTGYGSAQYASTVTIEDISTNQYQQAISVTQLNQSRSDASSLYGSSAGNSGFTATWNTSGLGSSYFTRILQVTASGGGCSITRTFNVTVSAR